VPAGKEGLASMAAQLLTKGAGSRSADEIATAIESAGGSLGGFAGDDFLSVSGSVLSNNVPLAMQLLADAVARPTFPAAEVELARQQTLSALQLEQSQPAAIAGRLFRAGLYGDHPYGRAARPATVRAITRDDLVAYQQARLKPQGALLVVAGDVTLPELRRVAEQSFAGWTGAPAAAPAAATPAARTRQEIVLVNRPGSVQANIVVGNLTTGPAEPTRYAATVANKVLGGGSDARLFEILRERKGWTYGAYSSLSRPRGVGSFSATAEVRNEVADSALVELLAQLRRVGAEPVNATELENAKNALVGIFPLSVETAQQIAEQVAQVKTLGLPADYLQTYRTRLAAVTSADVERAAQTYVRPGQALILVVGDASKLYDRLAKIGPVRVTDVEGTTVSAAATAAPTTAAPVQLDLARLAARRDSFAVMVQGNTIGSAVSNLRKTADGWAVSDTTVLAGGVVRITSDAATDARLALRRITRAGSVQGQAIATDVTVTNGRATGSASNPSPTGPQAVKVDVAVPSGAIAQAALGTALALLKWSPNATHTVTVLDESRGTVRNVTLAVTGTEKVTVPAGSFDAYRVEQTGGDQPVTYYVSTAAGNRVVRYTVNTQIDAVLIK
jgi:zinc protease